MAAYKNLVFKGGGVRGVAYLGALQYLYENGLMRSVARTAGTSAGAITALVVALNFPDFAQIKALSDSLDYRKIPSEGDLDSGHAGFLRNNPIRGKYQQLGIFKNFQCSVRLVQEKGWYSSDYFYHWLKETIRGQFAVEKESYTFADFKDAQSHAGARPFRDLYVTGTDITNRLSRVFSFETTPDMEVAMAVRISMSIPFFFEAIEYQYPGTDAAQVYVDGGVMRNYPITIFDTPEFCGKFSSGVNPETLGFFLYDSPTEPRKKETKGMVDYVSGLFECLIMVQEQFTLFGESDRERTIFIDDKGVAETQFDIQAGDETYKKLYDSGYAAAEEYFTGRANWDMLVHKIKEGLGKRH